MRMLVVSIINASAFHWVVHKCPLNRYVENPLHILYASIYESYFRISNDNWEKIEVMLGVPFLVPARSLMLHF